jgi:membrane-associated HD superfamily phosphohydrolase
MVRWLDVPTDRMLHPCRTASLGITAWLLLVVHAGLGLWGVVGFVELANAKVLWPSVTNPELPRWLLWLRWPLSVTAAAVIIGGYFARWRPTPWGMLVIYSGMAAMCAYETFFLLTNPNRYRAMAFEYLEYAVILAFLFLSSHMQERFSPSAS